MNLLDLARSALPATLAPDPCAPARRWRVRYRGIGPMEVLFTPPVTHGEVSAIYPSAQIEAQPEPIRRDLSPAETAELRALIAAVCADATEPELAEALAIALADPDAALRSFRALAAGLT